MSITLQGNRSTYTGNGVTTAFAFPFALLSAADMLVYKDGVLDATHTVTVGGTGGGSTVTFPVAPASGVIVTLVRSTPQTQPAVYRNHDSNSADLLMSSFDRLTLLCQDIQAQANRSLHFDTAANLTSTSTVVPLPGAGLCLGWGNLGALVTMPCGPTTISNNPVAINGTSQFLFTSKAGLLWEAALGTSGAPVTAAGAVLKVSKTMGITADPPAGCSNGIDNECGSALMVVTNAVAANVMMNVAISGIAFGDNQPGLTGGSGDQIGLIGQGRKAAGGGTAYGAYLEGRRDGIGTGIGIGVVGAEITQRNFTSSDCVYDGTGGNCRSVWVTGGGTLGKNLGVGVAVRDSAASGTGRFQVGFACTNFSVGNLNGACYDDQSNGTRGLRIGGTKTVGIDITGATLSGPAILLPNGPSTGQIAWGLSADPVSIRGTETTGLVEILSKSNIGTRIFPTPVLFANLGTPTMGTFAMCSDCTISNPCAGGGTGALAKRLGSPAVWVCN